MKQIEKKYSNKNFEDIKHITEDGIEYWYARELMWVMEYTPEFDSLKAETLERVRKLLF